MTKKKSAAPVPAAFQNTCAWCCHWHMRQDRLGDCRRNPPQVLAANQDGSQYAVFPIIDGAEAACGEFKPRIND